VKLQIFHRPNKGQPHEISAPRNLIPFKHSSPSPPKKQKILELRGRHISKKQFSLLKNLKVMDDDNSYMMEIKLAAANSV
jgi:hypothetical protein